LKKSLIAAVLVCAQGAVLAQQPSPTPSPNDVEVLRQQIEALTATVKTLQQQLKDQQETLAKMNAGPTTVPANANAAPTPAPGASSAPLFPTTD
jgi:septal ring factor EnvC (AmiA/AmiB activator)